MGLADTLAMVAGVGGAAIGGGLSTYQDEQDRALQAKKIEQAEEIAKMQADLKERIARLEADVKTNIHETPSGSVVAQQQGATDRANLHEGGLNTRFDKGLNLSYSKLFQDDDHFRQTDETRRRGQDFNYDLGTERNRLTGRGQDLNFSLGQARVGATTRGQDIVSRDRAAAIAAANQRAKDAAASRTNPYSGLFDPSNPGDVPGMAEDIEPVDAPALPASPSMFRPAPPAVAPPAAPIPAPARTGGVPVAPAAAVARPPVTGRTPVAPAPVATPTATPAPAPVAPTPGGKAAQRETERRQQFETIKAQIEERRRKGADISDLIAALKKLQQRGSR